MTPAPDKLRLQLGWFFSWFAQSEQLTKIQNGNTIAQAHDQGNVMLN